MSRRLEFAIGLGLIAGFVALLLWLRSGDDAPAPAPAATAPRSTTPAAPRPRSVAAEVEAEPALDEVSSPASEQPRDQTGELLSDGPAQPISLPEPPEGAQDNEPSPAESEAAITSVIARLDGEIAAARSAGDEAEAARLEVRRARLERKLAERRAP